MCLLGMLIGSFFIFLELRKRKVTPLLIFSALWTIILFLSSLQLYGLDKASIQGYAVIAIGMLGFGIGYMLFGNFRVKVRNSTCTYCVYDNILLVLSVITIALYFLDFTKVVSYLIDGQSLAYIRTLSQDSTSVLYSNRSNLEVALRTFIIQPFALAFQVIVAVEFWSGKKKWFIIDVIIIALRLFSEGSRSLLLYLGIHLVITFVFDRKIDVYINMYKFRKRNRRRKWILRCIVLIVLILVIASTFSRSGERVFRTTYYYFSMEPTMLGLWIDEIKELGYGLASINGLIFPILFLIKNILNLSSYPSYWYNNIFLLINDTDKVWKIIASFDSTRANAYVSVFWFAFLDGGYIGTFVILFILGMIYSLVYNHLRKYKNKKSMCVYAYLLQGLIFSFVRLQFADVSYALGFIFLLFFAFHKKRGMINEK